MSEARNSVKIFRPQRERQNSNSKSKSRSSKRSTASNSNSDPIEQDLLSSHSPPPTPIATSTDLNSNRLSISARQKPSAPEPDPDSIRSSMEGTPVILSREGSRIRIVDEETGEVFFRKRSRSRPRDYGGKTPIWIPRLSSTALTLEGQGQEVKGQSQIKSQNPFAENLEDEEAPKSILKKSSSRKLSTAHSQDNNNNEESSEIAIPLRKSRSRTRKGEETHSAVARRNPKAPSPSAKRRLSKDKLKNCTSIKELPDKILRKIFSYLDSEELSAVNKVCYAWKTLSDLSLRGPLVFKGRSLYGHHYSLGKTAEFVAYLAELEPRLRRPVELRFVALSEDQARALASNTDDKLSESFRNSVRHMEALGLANCSLKWKTLLGLLGCFSKRLRYLEDKGGDYYSRLGSCLCSSKTQLQKVELERKEFKDFKDGLRGLRKLTIRRATVTKELPVYLSIFAQGSKFLEELVLVLGPYDSPNSIPEQQMNNLLSHFGKELRGIIVKNKDTLKILRFSWSDSNFTGYFSTALEVLGNLKLKSLHSLSFNFDPHALKGKGISVLRDFLEWHYARKLRYFTMGQITLAEGWTQTAEFLDELLESTIPPSFAGLNFRALLCDAKGPHRLSAAQDLLRLEVFRRFLSSLHFSVEHEKTKSLGQLLGIDWNKKHLVYPQVNCMTLTFDPGSGLKKSFESFESFNLELVAALFPNLTQLRISDSDRGFEANAQIWNPLLGRRNRSHLSGACLENKDFTVICRELANLKICRLWVNMRLVDDHGVTGVQREDILLLKEDDENFSWTNFQHNAAPSFTDLKMLEELSLKGLGPGVTDLSLKFGFRNLEHLKLLELQGKLGITKKGRMEFRRNLKHNEIPTIVRIKYNSHS